MYVVYANMKHSVHKAFLLFFAALGLGEIIVQTYYFAVAASTSTWTLTDIPLLLRIWFYGLDVHTLFGSLHVDGSWPAVLVTLLAYVGSRIPAAKSEKLILA